MDFKAMGADLGLEEDEFRELIDLFMETGQSDYDSIKAALAGGDCEAAARYAHTLAGASGNLGLMDLHSAAKRIEQAAVEKQLADASAQAAEMEAMFSALAGFVNG
ncbi:MAG: Hpt domain-containing protein [Desulfosarcinaceae bacterium]|jgi:HPt (histidine-containing phosphotransfer) domain-containing protein